MTNIAPDWTSNPFTSVRVVEAPKHGEATLKEDTAFTGFAKENPRYECNKQKSSVTAVLYRGADGYTGKDAVTVEVAYPDGGESTIRYSIDVK
jgi:hypothetical protein